MQEAVRACVRFRLIHARPDLYIATVLHACCLLTVVSQVPIINFCEFFMNFTSIIEKIKKQWLLEEMFESRVPQAGGREEG